MEAVFIHGLESSSKGTKGKWFSVRYPSMLIPDFSGSFAERMEKLTLLLADKKDVVLIGSSFGGLMASTFVQENEDNVRQLILLAPALNFHEFKTKAGIRVRVPTELFIGKHDVICPPEVVMPIARKVFTDISIHLQDDDHSLHNTFENIDWASILQKE